LLLLLKEIDGRRLFVIISVCNCIVDFVIISVCNCIVDTTVIFVHMSVISIIDDDIIVGICVIDVLRKLLTLWILMVILILILILIGN